MYVAKGDFLHKKFIAMTDDGLVIVSETNAHRITIFDKEGKKIRSFGSYGTDR